MTTVYSLGSDSVIFSQGSPASGLNYSYPTDLLFSNNNGTTYTYTPLADAESASANVTNIRVNPKGTFACNVFATKPSFSIQFDVIVK